NYSIGLPTPATVQSGSSVSGINDMFSALLLQNGAAVYNEDGSRCVLDSLEGIEAFVQWSEFYTKYDLPVSFSDINRFRTGEMPIVITSYGFYNTLAVAAPEIQGLWTMAPIPGTLKEDGEIDRSVASSVSCAMIFQNAESVDDSWEFLKWWTSAEGQTLYGQEIEALQGRSARWATANLEAMQALPWSASISEQIQIQWKYVQGIPEVPGGYYLGRSVDNAIKSVINMGEAPRESLLDAVIQINNELRIKRQEFGLE
ncbi:MAG: extracellular solute-binding protein, partial [Clostridia bacterium]|nr:extracellular solute-binding protein [Clostridia bacterium]